MIKKNTQLFPITTIQLKGRGKTPPITGLISQNQGKKHTERVGLKNALESCKITCQCLGFQYFLSVAVGSTQVQVTIGQYPSWPSCAP